MAQVSNNRTSNYGSAIGTGVLGGVAWGTGQYLFNKRPFMDKQGNLSDTFVKRVESALVAVKDKATLDNIDFQKNLEKEIDQIASSDKLKEFISKKKDDFMRLTENDIKIFNDEVGKLDLEKAKSFVKGLFEHDGKYSKYYKETISSCYNDSKKLVHDATKMTQDKFDVIKKAIKSERAASALKSAGLFAGICALMCCLTEFFVGRNANKN